MHIDWGVVFATLVGPILAVWASELRQARKSFRERKENVFQTLMATRAARLRIEHVAAINQIDFAFPEKTCAAVQDAWGLYRKHLRQSQANWDEADHKNWQIKSSDLFADLLYQMALNLKIPFSKTDITDNSYYPDAYLLNELDQLEIRKLWLEVLQKKRAIDLDVNIKNPGQSN